MPKRSPLALLLLALALLLGGLTARAQPVSRHLALGNPSGAVADPAQPTNYLISRDQYAVGYNRDRGIPTWVSWHLQAADLGDTPRYEGPFITDTSLPAGWPRVTHADYTNSGYDRGHMTPSADRTASVADNEATFLLSNIIPQAPASNQGMWAQLEEYARTLVGQGNELYIVAGGAGSLGTLAGGKVTIPASVWKVMLVLSPADGDDAARVTARTTVVAMWSANDATTQGQTWQSYQTSVRCVEQRTGLDFFAAVEDTVEAAIEGSGCPATQDYRAYLPLVINGDAPVTPPTPDPAQVTIQQIEYDPPGDDVQGEYVLLTNSGGSAADMTGWTLRDLANNTYTFPTFSLAAGAQVRIWTKAGTDDAANLYWGRSQAVWNNSGGDTAILRDAAGTEVTRRSY
ncbi:MAG: hypothetical protein HGA45_31185 [Chloroflexales bacterium]|nr:hypothetical protein [Chloroflexales bacterium]